MSASFNPTSGGSGSTFATPSVNVTSKTDSRTPDSGKPSTCPLHCGYFVLFCFVLFLSCVYFSCSFDSDIVLASMADDQAQTRTTGEALQISFDTLTEALLNAMGFSIVECVNAIFQEKKPDVSWAEVGRKIQFQVEHMQRGCITLAEANTRLVINRLLTWATPESASFVRMRNPTSITEAVTPLQEYARVQMEKRNRHWTRPYDRPKEDRQEYNGNKKGLSHDSKPLSWVPTCFTCGIKGHKADTWPNRSSKQAKRGNDKVAQVNRVVSRGRTAPTILLGKVNSMECPIYIDSGAQVSIIDCLLVKDDQILDENISIVYADGKPKDRKMASVWVHVDSFSIPIKAAIIHNMCDPFILGRNCGEAFAPLIKKAVDCPYVLPDNKELPIVRAITRQQARHEAAHDQKVAEIENRDQPTPKSLEVDISIDLHPGNEEANTN